MRQRVNKTFKVFRVGREPERQFFSVAYISVLCHWFWLKWKKKGYSNLFLAKDHMLQWK